MIHACALARCGAIALFLGAVLASPSAAQTFALEIDAPPVLQATAERISAMNRRELVSALTNAGLEVPPRVHITLVPEADPRARNTPEWVVGRAFNTNHVVIFPQRVTSYPYDSLEAVVRHEIVHLALTQRADGSNLPRWFHEGVATTVEGGWGVREQVRLLVAAFERPAITDVDRLFASESSPATGQAYLLAAALVNDIRERHGSTVPGRIATRVANGAAFDAAFRLETGESLDDAVARAWSGYRRVSRWIPTVTSPAALWTFILALSVVAFLGQMRRRVRLRRQWAEEENAEWRMPNEE